MAGLIPQRGDDAAMLRGQYVAEATALDDRDDLDFCDLPLLPYVDAWRTLRREAGLDRFDGIEEQVFNADLGYAGRLDRRGTRGGEPFVLDIKTGTPARWHGLQLAAYAGCFPESWRYRRLGAYLNVDGSGRLREYVDHNDWIVFSAALTLSNWKGE